MPFDLREGADDGHGLASGNLTEGHRFHASGAVAVNSCADWEEKLADRRCWWMPPSGAGGSPRGSLRGVGQRPGGGG